MLAVSDDSLDWTRTHLIVVDRADVPTMIYDEETDRLWMFFVIFQANTRRDGSGDDVTNEIVAAYNTTPGSLDSWTFKRITINTSPTGFRDDELSDPVDPCVIREESDDDDGRYLLYFSMDAPGGPMRIWVARADHLEALQWDAEADAAFTTDGIAVVKHTAQDPAVLWVDDHYEMFAYFGPKEPRYHARSDDGLRFEPVGDGTEDLEYRVGPNRYPVVMPNGIELLPGSGWPRYRYLGFTLAGESHWIVSLSAMPTWSSGLGPDLETTWSMDSGARLTVDGSTAQEQDFVREAAVAADPTRGCHVMAYSTEIYRSLWGTTSPVDLKEQWEYLQKSNELRDSGLVWV